jgi:hypothetical protein
VIYLYLERFQENVLDRTSFFGSRKTRKAEPTAAVEGQALVETNAAEN